MLFLELRFTGRELRFSFIIQFITLMEVLFLEEINVKDKECSIKVNLL